MSNISTTKKLWVCFITGMLCFFGQQSVHATHIIGGEITYTCDGNNQYTITLKVYRDCFTGGASLDNPARISIYAADNLFNPFNTFNVSPTITSIPPSLDNPCLIPPSNICVQEGVYNLTVNLPFNPAGYHISYERCCRNPTIANIPNPNTFGATYTVFISDLAQNSCNNSPTFNDFPPIVICADQPIDFDHSAEDAEGDSLVYFFCSPFQGGSQTNPAPFIASPPPYLPVPFITTQYTSQFPMAGNPVVTIDSTTGVITGIPEIQGQFVVAVCVLEYRNGILLSTTQRDFQFNVTTCTQVVNANIQEDILAGPNQFILQECGDTVVTINNQSGDVNFIDDYYWGFETSPGDSLTSSQGNPTFTFPGIGTYEGVIIVNPGNETCTDTGFITLEIFPGIEADFMHDWDTCSPGPISFTDLSSIDTPIPNSYTWAFADGTITNDQNPVHQYNNPGIYVTTLQVEDINGCIDQESTTFEWFPAPNLSIDPDTTNGCEPLTVNFNNTSLPFDASYTFFWDFGDGNTSDALNPSHMYAEQGLYDITLASTSPNGCTDTLFLSEFIQVYDSPIANWDFSFDSCAIDVVSFFDQSIPTDGNIVAWDWDFGDSNISDEQNPEHLYDDAGSYNVSLTITDEFFCTQSFSQVVDWFPGPIINISPSVVSGCEPLEVFFANNSFPITGYVTEWDLGDGTITDEASPTHTYTDAGQYTVIFTQTSPTGCFSRDTFVNLINVDTLPIAEFSFQFDSCAIDVVTFTDASTPEAGDIVTWNWNFGDNITSPDQSPEHLYPDSGNWPATLIVTNTAGCSDTVTQIVDWFPAPIIEVEPSVVKGCEPLEVTFQNNSFPITGYETFWDLGDGTTSLAASPIHTFVDAGIYTISLTQTGPTGCVNTDTFVNLITVDTLPTSNFGLLFDSCSVDPIIFQDNSIAGSGTLESWNWAFGDGEISNDQSPVYQYPLAGNYDIELIVENSNGCFDTVVQNINYFPASDISFEADETRGCQPHTVNFTNFSSPINGYDIIWDFGDGNTSDAVNPTHVYTQAGLFNVTFTSTSPIGCTNTQTAFNYITVDSIPIANFTWLGNEDSCLVGPINYQDLSIVGAGPINSWTWDFDDGSVPSNEVNPVHLFSGAGIFDVMLSVEDVNGCVDDTTQTIVWAPAPIIDVTPDDDWGCTPFTVNFENNSFPINGYDIFWDFGDGNVDTAVVSPSNTYQNQGLYDVTLQIISPLGCESLEVFEGMIKVDSVPTAQFDWNYENCLVGLTNFEDESIENDGRITDWVWDFGDGNLSDFQSPYHDYDTAGFYDVTLIVTDFNLCSDTVTQEVEWYPPAEIDIDVDDYLGCNPHPVTFINNIRPMDGYTVFWNFGDDTTSEEWEPSHVYIDPGNYDVTISANNSINCLVTETINDMVRITPPPIADFTFNPNNPTNFEPEVTFTEFSQFADSWNWDFGNGDFTNVRNPVYSYPDTGIYPITLVVGQLSGCTDSLTQFIDVSPLFTYFLPNAFTPNDDQLNDGFRGTGLIETISSFDMIIWNRWGESIFQTSSPEEAWNGRKNNSGKPSPPGVYIYTVKILSGRGEEYTYEGFVTLVR